MQKAERVWTIVDILKWSEQFFKEKGVDSPRLTIELLLCQVLKTQRINLYAEFDKPLKPSELSQIREYVIRRAKREPLQYILGSTNFMGIDLKIKPGALIPRPETEQLVALAIEYIKKNKVNKILDIGTGSGCIAIALAKEFPNAEILTVDKSEKALQIASENIDTLEIRNIRLKKLDILSETPQERFDLIISNPPYIPENDYLELEPEVNRYEPPEALKSGTSGLVFYQRFVKIFPELLNSGGAIFLEFGYNQRLPLNDLFLNTGFLHHFEKDFSGYDRYLRGVLS